MLKNTGRFCAVLLIALAALWTACSDGGDGGVAGGDGSGGGGFGGGGGGVSSAGDFSVALASKVTSTTSAIVAPGSGATGVVGLAVDAHEVKVGVPVDSEKEAATQLEVWVTNSDYFTSDGALKEKNGEPYVATWSAYSAADPEQTVMAEDPDTFDASLVTLGLSHTSSLISVDSIKMGRWRIQVGGDVLNSGGVLVVSIFEPGTPSPEFGATEGLLAQSKLSLAKADAPDLSSLKISADGKAGTSVPTQAGIDQSIGPVTVTGSGASATATLALTSAASSSTPEVAYNNFQVDKDGFFLYSIAGATAAGNVAETKIAKDGNTAGDKATVVTHGDAMLLLSAASRADFTASSGKTGQVTLTVSDKYGQRGTVAVTLDPKFP